MTNKDAFIARWSHLFDTNPFGIEEFAESVDELVRESHKELLLKDAKRKMGQQIKNCVRCYDHSVCMGIDRCLLGDRDDEGIQE